MENWKQIKDYEFYEISDKGRVRKRLKDKNYKYPKLSDSYGYQRVYLYVNGKVYRHSVHRLVAIHFLDNFNNYPCVNHKNSIRNDNRVENLEWCSYQYNNKHAFDYGLNKKGEYHHNSKLTNNQVLDILNSVSTVKQLSIIYKVSIYTIYRIKKRDIWKHIKLKN